MVKNRIIYERSGNALLPDLFINISVAPEKTPLLEKFQ